MKAATLKLRLAPVAIALWFFGQSLPAQGSGTQEDSSAICIPLGTLEPFWRYSAALGPFLEGGQALLEIHDYLCHGDFAYKKRPYPLEVPFADHLSLVRVLGGYNDGSDSGAPDPAIRERDLAWRDDQGGIHYRLEMLEPRLRPYLDNGYTNLTIVLDNVPWCFPKQPLTGKLGQRGGPRDPKEWYDFVRAACGEISRIMGPEAANRLRFRVGTENNGITRFNGTHEEFIRHYDATAAAIKSVLPGAKAGAFNISGVGMRGLERANVRSFDLAKHCFNEPSTFNGESGTPFDWIAFSRYYSPGDDLKENAHTCGAVWEEFARRVPQLKGVSREIHEFGIAPFGEEKKGAFVSAEDGALGAAATAQMMICLREAGIDRLWHWSGADRFRDRRNKLQYLFTGQSWLLSVFERARSGESWLLKPVGKTVFETQFIGLASVKPDEAIFIFSAYSKNTAADTPETVRFQLSMKAADLANEPLDFVVLNRDTAVHDQIRRDLKTAGLLSERFMARPDRLGSIREMGEGRAAEQLVSDKLPGYIKLWQQSLTLTPLPESIGTMTAHSGYYEFTLRLTSPEVLVIRARRALK